MGKRKKGNDPNAPASPSLVPLGEGDLSVAAEIRPPQTTPAPPTISPLPVQQEPSKPKEEATLPKSISASNQTLSDVKQTAAEVPQSPSKEVPQNAAGSTFVSLQSIISPQQKPDGNKGVPAQSASQHTNAPDLIKLLPAQAQNPTLNTAKENPKVLIEKTGTFPPTAPVSLSLQQNPATKPEVPKSSTEIPKPAVPPRPKQPSSGRSTPEIKGAKDKEKPAIPPKPILPSPDKVNKQPQPGSKTPPDDKVALQVKPEKPLPSPAEKPNLANKTEEKKPEIPKPLEDTVKITDNKPGEQKMSDQKKPDFPGTEEKKQVDKKVLAVNNNNIPKPDGNKKEDAVKATKTPTEIVNKNELKLDHNEQGAKTSAEQVKSDIPKPKDQEKPDESKLANQKKKEPNPAAQNKPDESRLPQQKTPEASRSVEQKKQEPSTATEQIKPAESKSPEQKITDAPKPSEQRKPDTSKPTDHKKPEAPKTIDQNKREWPKSGDQKKPEAPKPVDQKKSDTPKLADQKKPEAAKPADLKKPEATKAMDQKKPDTPKPADQKKTDALNPSDEKKVDISKPEDQKNTDVPKLADLKNAEAAKPADQKKPEAPKSPDQKKPDVLKSAEQKKADEPKQADQKKPEMPKPPDQKKPEVPKPVDQKKPDTSKSADQKKPDVLKPADQKKPEISKPTEQKKQEMPKPAEQKKPDAQKSPDPKKPQTVKSAEQKKPATKPGDQKKLETNKPKDQKIPDASKTAEQKKHDVQKSSEQKQQDTSKPAEQKKPDEPKLAEQKKPESPKSTEQKKPDALKPVEQKKPDTLKPAEQKKTDVSKPTEQKKADSPKQAEQKKSDIPKPEQKKPGIPKPTEQKKGDLSKVGETKKPDTPKTTDQKKQKPAEQKKPDSLKGKEERKITEKDSSIAGSATKKPKTIVENQSTMGPDGVPDTNAQGGSPLLDLVQEVIGVMGKQKTEAQEAKDNAVTEDDAGAAKKKKSRRRKPKSKQFEKDEQENEGSEINKSTSKQQGANVLKDAGNTKNKSKGNVNKGQPGDKPKQNVKSKTIQSSGADLSSLKGEGSAQDNNDEQSSQEAQQKKKRKRKRNKTKAITQDGKEAENVAGSGEVPQNSEATSELKKNFNPITPIKKKSNKPDENDKQDPMKKESSESKLVSKEPQNVPAKLSEEQLTHLTRTAVHLSQSTGDTDMKFTPDLIRCLLAKKPTDISSTVEDEGELEYHLVQRQVFLPYVCHVCKSMESKNCSLKKCNDCKLISYCSKKHQKDHWPAHKDLCTTITNICKQENMSHLFEKALGLSPNAYRLYRNHYVNRCGEEMGRELQLWEKEMIYHPLVCHSCYECDMQKLISCQYCSHVNYCSANHRRTDHDRWCKQFQIYRDITLHQFHNGMIRPVIPETVFEEYIPLFENMESFLSRTYNITEKSVQMSRLHFVTLTDVATCPFTVLFALQNCGFPLKICDSLSVHIIGAEIYFEVDNIKKWEMFLLHLVPSIKTLRVVFTGPELKLDSVLMKSLSETKVCHTCSAVGRKVVYEFWPGLYHNFMNCEKYSSPDLICAFNSGLYRPSDYGGEDTWSPTIDAIFKGLNVPLVVTEYTEQEIPLDISRITGISTIVETLMPPTINPFASLKPSLNFLSEETVPIIFKNFYITIVKGANV